MRLYSIQPLEVYACLAQGQVWTAAPFEQAVREGTFDEVDASTQRAYDWLGRQMRQQGLIPQAEQTRYPIWAWHQWGGAAQRKPDLRTKTIRDWAHKSPQVLLTLEIPESRVLLSDYDAWHWVLNYWYLGEEPVAERFRKRCARKNLDYFRQKPLPDVRLHTEVEESWRAIFDLPLAARLLEASVEAARVQATFWELRPEDVVTARQYHQKGAAHALPVPA